mmetsp:Transcript_22988/g.56841  ORF Transcript_22988/g.56841 Transcript_22988/m.56841 type:complete len:209 (-) Transcript_22988:335-961(-)
MVSPPRPNVGCAGALPNTPKCWLASDPPAAGGGCWCSDTPPTPSPPTPPGCCTVAMGTPTPTPTASPLAALGREAAVGVCCCDCCPGAPAAAAPPCIIMAWQLCSCCIRAVCMVETLLSWSGEVEGLLAAHCEKSARVSCTDFWCVLSDDGSLRLMGCMGNPTFMPPMFMLAAMPGCTIMLGKGIVVMGNDIIAAGKLGKFAEGCCCC